ncbi:uncharacterized protein LOC120487624 [Pimephales promelas]|uniref:uncharacterized protein LOC120487624 n=1 Tax=Pimephales promelas TaxID=90988 RepID=UPI001955AFEB|nr:uncharacterized protein LOC120487624 [Pimephales promelas]
MSASTDVESQSRSRGRRLDAFLIGSVIALFLMFAGALAGALWFAKHIENELNERKTRESESEASTGPRNMHLSDTGDAYKMQNFAYLRAIKSELKSENMAWEGFAYGNTHTIGSLYSYDKSQKALDVKNSGSYFVYVQLSLFCNGICSPGKFTVSFYNHLNSKELSCTVSLPEGTKPEPISKTCWHVVTFPENGNRLMAKSEVQDSLGDWSLLVNDSGFGMFLVDGVRAEQRT